MTPSKDLPVPKYREWAAGHGTPWEVAFPKTVSTPYQRKFYQTEELAKKAIQDWSNGRDPSASVGKRKLDALLTAEQLLPPGVTILDAVRFYLSRHGNLSTVTVADLGGAYLAKLAMDKAAAKYVEEQTRMVKVAEREFGPETLAATALTKAKLVAFINADRNSYWNRYARRRIASVLISQAREQEVLKENPLEGWELKKPAGKRPAYLEVWEVKAIMDYVWQHRPDLVASFALQLWSGIRTEELCRVVTAEKRPLAWSDIDFGRKICVEAEVSKMSTRAVIDFWPHALTHWLAPVRKSQGPVCPVLEFDDVKSKLIKAMNRERKELNQPKVNFRQNCFRHSFASYTCAFWQDAGPAQLALRQVDKDVFWTNYREYVTEEDAKLYMGSALDEDRKVVPFVGAVYPPAGGPTLVRLSLDLAEAA
jgi:integrase